MYSEVLAEIDRNTVMYMYEDMQNKCSDIQNKCNDMQNTIQTQKSQLAQKDVSISQKDTIIAEKDRLIEELQVKLKEKNKDCYTNKISPLGLSKQMMLRLASFFTESLDSSAGNSPL